MPAGEGGKLFLATRDMNFRVNPYRKKLYDEVESEHLYFATRHFPEIKCSHGNRCTKCASNLRRPRRNEPMWRESHEWEVHTETGFIGNGKDRMGDMIQARYDGVTRINAIMTKEIPRPKTTSSTCRRLKEINATPVQVDNKLQSALRQVYDVKQEYNFEADDRYRAQMEHESTKRTERRIARVKFDRTHGITFRLRNLIL